MTGEPFTFIHAADLHLDTPFKGVSEASARAAKTLRDATLKAFDNLVALAVGERARFVVIAGDVFDGPTRSVRAAVRFMEGVEKLGREGIDVFVATGNHDPLRSEAWSLTGEAPENLHIFPAKPAHFTINKDDVPLAVVHGVSYPRREVTDDIAASIKRADAGCDDCYHVAVAHATVGGHTGHEPYAQTRIEKLAASGIDYWALGHVHTRAVISPDSPAIFYPGNPQALSPREEGARGAYVVKVDAHRRVETTFKPLDLVRFASVETDLTGLDDPAAVKHAMIEKIEEARAGCGERALVLTPVLSGPTPLYAELEKGRATADLIEELAERYEHAEPLVWVNKIKNHTRPLLNLDKLRARRGLEAVLLEEAQLLLADPEELMRVADEHLKPLYSKRDARRLLGDAPGTDELAAEVEAARDLALSLLGAATSEDEQ